jgi:3-oxoacyl-(acyl-carrier-protein) synthase
MGVRVTGIGIVSAIGLTVGENLRALREGKSGIGPVRYLEGAKASLAGEVKMSNSELADELGLAAGPVSRTSLLGLKAAREAWGDNKRSGVIRTGIISATSVGGMDRSEVFYQDYLNKTNPDYDLLKTHDSGSTTERIAAELGISGYINTLSTACSSGANAIMLGARLILQGKLDRVLVGGSDALARFTIDGFRSLMIYDDQWCRPFDESRSGLIWARGPLFCCLRIPKLCIDRQPYLMRSERLGQCGGCLPSDRIVAGGQGATMAIENAIEKSGLNINDISYVNAHGTGTKNNDPI